MKNVEKNNGRIFTKNNRKDIIKKHNLLNKNFNFYEREGLPMREEKNIVLEKLNLVEKIFFRKKFIEIYKEGVKAGYNWSNSIVR